ncbi:hypothetical protein L5515_005337 [Caenorhabditis briggsae]|uniref:Uncharacterized protein n=1 Tax=Caenorhabditis briggsae TaxID=6238 RepID=A0AAE9JE19_CAEBR|nr:hypothetical protein L5515_005337 [Caenorhabditis briggsae]
MKQLRSLIRVRLTKYFPSDRYLKNRCSGADGVLIDMERRAERADDYKISSFMKLRNSYHRINDGDILWNSSIRTAVQGSLENDIQPLAARTLVFRDIKTATHEFKILRQIGFTGAVIRNPNLIEMTNKVFEK